VRVPEGDDNRDVTAIRPIPIESAAPARRTWPIALLLIVTGATGWWGAMALITERVAKLIDPQHVLNCDINPLVSCGSVMTSWQASLLGFPNPLLGVAGFVAPVAVGVALLAGAEFARWFWALLVIGVAGAWLFVTWLFAQSVYVIGALCPWCMLVWAATIPMFWWLLGWALAAGHVGGAASAAGASRALPFVWVVVLANYAAIALAIIAQFPTLLPSLF
jgi:uncharacterized membrane protein